MARVCARGLLVTVAVLCASSSARASPSSWRDRDFGVAFAETIVTRARLQSPMPINGDDAPRNLVGLGVPVGARTLVGFGFGIEWRVGYLTERFFEFRYSLAPDQSSAVLRAEGAPVSVDLGSIKVIEVGSGLFTPIPGFQYIPDNGSWKMSLRFIGGLSWTWATATTHDARGNATASGIVQTDGYVRGDASLCARLGHGISGLNASHDTISWACLTAQPYVYARDWWGGASLGLRLEL